MCEDDVSQGRTRLLGQVSLWCEWAVNGWDVMCEDDVSQDRIDTPTGSSQFVV